MTKEQIAGGLIGLIVGDALGVPYEFHPASDMPFDEEIEFEPPRWFRRAHAGVPPGTYSEKILSTQRCETELYGYNSHSTDSRIIAVKILRSKSSEKI